MRCFMPASINQAGTDGNWENGRDAGQAWQAEMGCWSNSLKC